MKLHDALTTLNKARPVILIDIDYNILDAAEKPIKLNSAFDQWNVTNIDVAQIGMFLQDNRSNSIGFEITIKEG